MRIADDAVLMVRIDELIAQHGGMRAAALVLKTDAGYLSRLRSGEKIAPGEALLKRMRLVRHETITYRRIK